MAFERVSGAFGRLLAALAFAGCLLLLAMLAIIVTDVALRNLAVPGLPRGLAWSKLESDKANGRHINMSPFIRN